MRRYQPIWLALKKKRELTVTCAPEHRCRLRKAVIKEKDLDLEHKEIYYDKLRARLLPNGIHFTLTRDGFANES